MLATRKDWLIRFFGVSSTILLAAFFLQACAGVDGKPPGTLQDLIAQIQATTPRSIEKYKIPGAAVALVHNGEVAWIQGFGLADEANQEPMTPDTILQVASISKSITAWGVMWLVEEGKIDLDDPVGKYLIRWQLPASSFDNQEVTIRRLLSHTAGLEPWEYPGVPIDEAHPGLVDLLSGSASNKEVQVSQQPGLKGTYSNASYLLLQLVIEDITGETFSDYMQRQVLQPLGMQNSTFEWTSALRSAIATGYTASGAPVEQRWVPEAAGGLYATPADLATWLAAGMTGLSGETAGRNVLQPQTLEEMMTPVSVLSGRSDGLGYAVENLPNGTQMVLHSGDMQGWRGQYAALPDQRDGIVVLTNSNTSRYFIALTICNWAKWAAGAQPKACQVYQVVFIIIPTIALLIGAGALITIVRLVREARTGKRVLTWRQNATPNYQEIILALLGIILWWFYISPRMSLLLPPEYLWISLAFTLWCLVTAAKGMTVKVIGKGE